MENSLNIYQQMENNLNIYQRELIKSWDIFIMEYAAM